MIPDKNSFMPFDEEEAEIMSEIERGEYIPLDGDSEIKMRAEGQSMARKARLKAGRISDGLGCLKWMGDSK